MVDFKRISSLFITCASLLVISSITSNAVAVEDRLKHYKLPNGFNVFVKEDPARKVATLQLWVTVGSADEEEKNRGISHVFEHMAFKGTERRGVGQIASEIESLGGETNAYTSWDETVFHVTVPSHAVSQGLDILVDAVLRPSINPGELEKEKQVVIEEILEGEERPERKASKLLFDTAYTNSPYKYPVIGYKDTVEKISRDDMLSFKNKWYVPENMFLLVVGDVNAEQVAKEMERLTSDIQAKGFFRAPRPQEPNQTEIRTSVLKDRNSRETRLFLAYHIPSMKGVDVNALDLVGDLLGSRDNSRLVRILKKEKGLVNSVAAYALTPKQPGLMIIQATLASKNVEPVVQIIMEEMERLKAEPPTPQELEEAKVHIESQHIYARETVQGMARSLGSFQADMGDINYEKKYLALNSAVTPKQISDVVSGYMAAPNLSMAILVPEDEANGFDLERVKAILSSHQKGSKAPVAQQPQEKPTTYKVLDNGIRLVITPDDSNPVVSIRFAMLGGKRFESKETEGIMNFIQQMLTKGTADLDEVQIAQKVDKMGGRLTGFSGYDSFGFYGSFFSRFFEDGITLMRDIYLNPAFPQDKLERERALILNRIKTEPDRPVTYAINELNGAVFPQHPYGFVKEGTIATVSGFNVADLKEVYDRFSVPSNLVVTVVGDVKADKAVEKLTEILGKIPAKPLDKPDVPKEEPIVKQREKIVKLPRAKAHLAIGFKGTTLFDEDRYALEVLNNILAGQGGRLFKDLRDKQSLAYIVTSFVRPGIDPGVFAFYIATDPNKLQTAIAGLEKQIELIKQSPVESKELERSINNLIGNHLINLQSSWSRAENDALNTLYGLGYDFDSEYVKRVSKVTADDVLRVAKKYLDLNHSAIVKILPEEDEHK
jgi:zinc protease